MRSLVAPLILFAVLLVGKADGAENTAPNTASTTDEVQVAHASRLLALDAYKFETLFETVPIAVFLTHFNSDERKLVKWFASAAAYYKAIEDVAFYTVNCNSRDHVDVPLCTGKKALKKTPRFSMYVYGCELRLPRPPSLDYVAQMIVYLTHLVKNMVAPDPDQVSPNEQYVFSAQFATEHGCALGDAVSELILYDPQVVRLEIRGNAAFEDGCGVAGLCKGDLLQGGKVISELSSDEENPFPELLEHKLELQQTSTEELVKVLETFTLPAGRVFRGPVLLDEAAAKPQGKPVRYGRPKAKKTEETGATAAASAEMTDDRVLDGDVVEVEAPQRRPSIGEQQNVVPLWLENDDVNEDFGRMRGASLTTKPVLQSSEVRLLEQVGCVERYAQERAMTTTPSMVMFVVPWSVLSRAGAVDFHNASRELRTEKDAGPALAAVDCSEDTEECLLQGITAFPTFFTVHANGSLEHYVGAADALSLYAHVHALRVAATARSPADHVHDTPSQESLIDLMRTTRAQATHSFQNAAVQRLAIATFVGPSSHPLFSLFASTAEAYADEMRFARTDIETETVDTDADGTAASAAKPLFDLSTAGTVFVIKFCPERTVAVGLSADMSVTQFWTQLDMARVCHWSRLSSRNVLYLMEEQHIPVAVFRVEDGAIDTLKMALEEPFKQWRHKCIFAYMIVESKVKVSSLALHFPRTTRTLRLRNASDPTEVSAFLQLHLISPQQDSPTAAAQSREDL